MRLSLETTDHATAVRKVLENRAEPQLLTAGRREFEVDRYLRDQQERGRLSPSYGKSRRYVLMKFATDNGVESPREVNTSVLQRWYDKMKGMNGETAKHYLVHVRVHDMRRSFASNRVSAGVSIEKTSNWLGDTIAVAWKNYSRFLPADSDINLGAA